MAFNQVKQYYRGYVYANGNIGSSVDGIAGIIAGLNGLLLKGSTDLSGVCVDHSGNIYVSDAAKHIILKITESGNIYVIGGLSGVSGDNGSTTVSVIDSRFNYPTGLCCDSNGDIYVCDTGNHQIRKISNDKVSLVAGAATPTSGTSDGVGTSARFNRPYDVDMDRSGIIYVADTYNHTIRKIVGGVVTTIAGSGGVVGNAPVWSQMITAEGILGINARFNYPYAVACHPNGYIYVSDTNNFVIKRIDPAGRIRIFSGSGVYGTTIGTAKTSRYQDLRFSDINKSGDFYVVDFNEGGASRLIRINEEGVPGNVINFTPLPEGKFLVAIACNPADHLIVVESEFVNLEYSSSSSSSIDSSSSTSSSSTSLSSVSSGSSISRISSESIGNISTSSSSELYSSFSSSSELYSESSSSELYSESSSSVDSSSESSV